MLVNCKLVFTLFLLLIYGCGDNSLDLNAPTIVELSYNPIPVEDTICGSIDSVVFHLLGGQELSLDINFQDDVALSQYKVDIHNNFDCHGHGGHVAPKLYIPNVENQTIDWTVLDIQIISGTSVNIKWNTKLPENITAGNYHFHIQAIDESGNDSPLTHFYSINVNNPLDNIAPQVNVSQPTSNNFNAKKGESLRFVGEVTDNRSLSDGGNGVLYLSFTDLDTGNSFATDMAFPFDQNVDTVFKFDFEYIIPSTLVSGSYRFSLGAHDGVRNVAQFSFFDVEITN